MKVIFYEGLWGLGKSYDINQAQGFKLPESYGRSLGQMRYAHSWFELMLVKQDLVRETAHFDRTPVMLLALASAGVLDSTLPFLGSVQNSDLSSRLGGLFDEWADLVKGMTDHEIEIRLYKPRDWDAYSQHIETLDNEKWLKSKMLTSLAGTAHESRESLLMRLHSMMVVSLLEAFGKTKHVRVIECYSKVH